MANLSIFEDDQSHLLFLRTTAELDGHILAHVATNPEQADELAAAIADGTVIADAIFLDMNLSKEGGNDGADGRRILGRIAGANALVIVNSAETMAHYGLTDERMSALGFKPGTYIETNKQPDLIFDALDSLAA